jgi:hypothetical protein
MSRPVGNKNEVITEMDLICMNPRAESCSVCIFYGSKWCKPEERLAKALFDIERRKKERLAKTA